MKEISLYNVFTPALLLFTKYFTIKLAQITNLTTSCRAYTNNIKFASGDSSKMSHNLNRRKLLYF